MIETAISLPGARTLEEVMPQRMLDAGAALGVPPGPAKRILAQLVERVNNALKAELLEASKRHEALPEAAHGHVPGERQVMRVMEHIVIREMTAWMKP